METETTRLPQQSTSYSTEGPSAASDDVRDTLSPPTSPPSDNLPSVTVGESVVVGNSSRPSQSSWLSRSVLSQHVVHPEEGLSPYTSTAIVINYISAGYILLAGAAAHGGILLASVVLSVTATQSFLTSKFVLEACARAEAIDHMHSALQFYEASTDLDAVDSAKASRSSISMSLVSRRSEWPERGAGEAMGERETVARSLLVGQISDGDEKRAAVMNGSERESTVDMVRESVAMSMIASTPSPSERLSRASARNYPIVRYRKYELPVLNQIFLGKWWSYLFTITTLLDLYSITWTFAAIFGSALEDEFPVPGISNNYIFYVGIFMLVSVPLSNTSILDQLWVQVGFLAGRLLMVFLMISTLAAAYANPDQAHFGTQIGPANGVPLVDWRSMVQVIQTSIFSTSFQFSVPSIGNVTHDKKVVCNIFRSAVIFSFVSNLILSIMSAVYFGVETNPSNNLNWRNYHGGTEEFGIADRAPWSAAIAYYVTLFAAIDGLAIYPLNALALADIMMGSVYGAKVHEAEKNWKIRMLFRLLASVPQGIGAMFVQNLGFIALYGGVFTLASYTLNPALLCLKSRQRMAREGLPLKTYYSSTFSWIYPGLAFGLAVLALLVIIGVIVDSLFVDEERIEDGVP